jgi:hypothetical protein
LGGFFEIITNFAIFSNSGLAEQFHSNTAEMFFSQQQQENGQRQQRVIVEWDFGGQKQGKGNYCCLQQMDCWVVDPAAPSSEPIIFMARPAVF